MKRIHEIEIMSYNIKREDYPDELYFVCDKLIPYDTCEQILQGCGEENLVVIHIKTCKKCGNVYISFGYKPKSEYWAKITYERFLCDDCKKGRNIRNHGE